MRVTSKTRKLLADIKKMCFEKEDCTKCPFWDKLLECRFYAPSSWLIDDWEEYKDENT